MSDPMENEFNTWYGNYAGNYSAPPPPPITDETPTPPPSLGFGAYANTPPVFGGYSSGSYRPSPPDTHRTATQGMQSMNLSASFESVSNIPAQSPSKAKRKKTKSKPKPKGKANQDSSDDGTHTNRPPVAYSLEETVAIAFCWSAVTTQDLRKGVDQTGVQFWRRIEHMYNTKKKPENTIDRDHVQLKSHFGRAQTKVALFNGFYLQCKEQWPSGSSDDDIYDAAAKLYYNKNNKQHFVLKDAWKIFLGLPKYQGVGSDKRQKGLDESSNSSRSKDDAPFFSHERPIGKTAAKGKGKAIANVQLPDLPEEKIVNLLDTTAEANRDFSEWAKSRLVYEKTKAIKTYVKLKEKDTSNMSPDDLEEYFNMLAMLIKSLDL